MIILSDKEINMNNKKKKWHSPIGVLKIIMFAIFGISLAVLFGLAFGFAVKYLWNVIVVSIFSIREITYWEAVGIIVLCKLLFGGLHPHPHMKDKHRGHAGPGLSRFFGEMFDERHKEFSSYWESEGRNAFQQYCEKKQNDKQTTASPDTEK